MSTKSTIVYAEKTNEHWYYDCMDQAITIEVGPDTFSEISYDNEDGFILTLKSKSELNKLLMKRLRV